MILPKVHAMAQIALLVETALGSGREILRGISQYVHERQDWEVFHASGSLGRMMPEVLDHWDGDGIIARVHTPEMLAVLRAKKVPVVDVLGNYEDADLYCVRSDNRAIARLVFEHFYERGFRSFAFLGLEGERWSDERCVAYEEFAMQQECFFAVRKVSHDFRQQHSWNHYRTELVKWMEQLPKPVGLFVCSDQFAPDLASSCSVARIRIPDEVAMVGVDNDPAFCEVIQPSLSSVDANHAEVGYVAAAFLGRILQGQEQRTSEHRVQPTGVVTRQSSDAFAITDEGIRKALLLIREHACEGISVDHIAQHAGYSRSVLQRRFRSLLGRTVHDAILATKLARAKELLVLTRLPLLEVAVRSGFNYQEYLNHVFKDRIGMTPGEYRKRFSNQRH